MVYGDKWLEVLAAIGRSTDGTDSPKSGEPQRHETGQALTQPEGRKFR
jgi:hypothetical protein